MPTWTRKKALGLEGIADHHRLTPTLGPWHLITMGVGAIVGTGIYTLVGVGANMAGPAVTISFFIAGSICACAALAYAEVATIIPASGSAYTYSYVALGELIAWIVGWSLILEYSLCVSAVAVGWSGYAVGFLHSVGIHMPLAVSAGPHAGGLINLPAVVIVAVVAAILNLGTKESANLNAVLVGVKIAALIIFVAVVLPHFKASHFTPFMPTGFAAHAVNGQQQGVMAAAAIIFFAFYGFDAVSTAAEETKNPGRDMPIGIVGSMGICTTIYIVVAFTAVGGMPISQFAHSPEPLALIVRQLGSALAATLIGAAAIVALPTVILAFLFGQSRIFFVMARDGLLPTALAKVNPKTGVPSRITIMTAVVVGVLSGLAPLDEIAALANAGTLVAFIAVCVCLPTMRRTHPDAKRLFRVPGAFVVAWIGILGCLYLFWSLPQKTHIFFSVWTAIGLLIYFAWSARRFKTGGETQPAEV